MVKLKDKYVRDHHLLCLLTTMWWAEGTSNLSLLTAHPVLQEVPRPRAEMGTEAQGRQTKGRGKARVTICPAHNPHISNPLALHSQNALPTQILLSSWIALGSQQKQKGKQSPLTNLPCPQNPAFSLSPSCSVPSPTPPTLTPHFSIFY